MKNLLKIFLPLTLLVFVQVSCNTTEPPIIPPPDDTIANTILITLEWKDLYRIKLNWNKAKADTTTSHPSIIKHSPSSYFQQIYAPPLPAQE